MRRCFDLALVLAMAIPYGQSWVGFCSMAKAEPGAVHACPHHRPADDAKSAHCHSKSNQPRARALTCNCGNSGHDEAAASAVTDRFGLVEAVAQNLPGYVLGELELASSAAPPSAIPEPPTPPPRFCS
jgi:hypothetical protein